MSLGGSLDVPIRFAPREVKDYYFVIPFMVNGTSKVNVTVAGKGTLRVLNHITSTASPSTLVRQTSFAYSYKFSQVFLRELNW
jgi:hypothetical protein